MPHLTLVLRRSAFRRGLFAACACAVVLGVVARAADSSALRAASRVVLELPPGPGNPRNSEGAFVALKDGGILFVYSRFTGASFGDAAKAQLAARRSRDSGETWSDDSIIATPAEDQAMNVMSVSLLRLGDGDIGLFYLLRRSWHDTRMYCRRSHDEALTWGEPVLCMPAAGYYVVNNDRVVRLASGRLVIPAAWHRSLADRNEASAVDWRGIAVFFVSDDDGRTWRQAPGYATLPVPQTKSGLQEPGVVELPNGTLWAWARTDLGRQYEFFSSDAGETWSAPAPSRFTSPNSPLSMKRLPEGERLVAIWNPVPAYETRALKPVAGDRTPLVVATGLGPTNGWTPGAVLEGDDTAGYCYTAIHFTGDAVLLAYCAGGAADRNRLARLRVRKIPLTALK